MTERTLLDTLEAARYPRQSWAFLRHVNEGTGMQAGRIIDAVAMSLWPSRGLVLHGIEVKCHRSDWQRELAAPSKADFWFGAVHVFYVAAPPGVVKPEEVPAGWGFLEVGDKVRALRDPDAREPPPVSWKTLAALLRAAVRAGDGVVPLDEVEARVEKQLGERLAREIDVERRRHREQLQRETELRQAVMRFERAAGASVALCTEEQARLAGQVMRGEQVLDVVHERLTSTRTTLENLLTVLNREVNRG